MYVTFNPHDIVILLITGVQLLIGSFKITNICTYFLITSKYIVYNTKAHTVEGKRKVTEFSLVPELLQSSIRSQPEYRQNSHRQMGNSNRDLSEFLQKSV